MGLYDVGDERVLEARFYDESGALADPTTVTLTITSPAGVVTTPAVTHPSLGVYSYDLTLSSAGVWAYVWAGAGVIDQVEGGSLLVGSRPGLGPCSPWCSPDELFATGAAASIASADRDYVGAVLACQAASEYLYQRSGRRFPGLCSRTVRPCARSGRTGAWWDVPFTLDVLALPSSLACGCGAAAPAGCACGGYDDLDLPGEPVVAIAEVRVDGAVVPASAYRLDSWRHLVRIDGELWPTCQDLSADPATDDNTFSVTYWHGREVPALGGLAARELAAELYLSIIGSADCRLPRQVQSLSRQGVTMAFVTQPEYGEGNSTGLPTVDAFLGAFGARRQATIASPDVGPRARTSP